MHTTAAGIIIGDEILSGKVRDTNTPLLVKAFRLAGVRLERLVVIGDRVADIAGEVKHCADRYDYVVTSGGVGPTHDDRTMEGVAAAFSQAVYRHPDLEKLVRQAWGDRLNEAALKMTEVPQGARLAFEKDSLFPLVALRNIYILPGIPQLFAAKMEQVQAELQGTPLFLRSIFLTSDESSFAALLHQVEREFSQVAIGSYPVLGAAEYRVEVTVEGPDPQEVDRAVQRLLGLLPAAQVFRVAD